MSFKRAGDDHCALRLQKKHRVTDLLAEDIPADEASKTRSGRFACLVCPHNPVLDTMAMLTLHRQGKKHLANMAIKIEKEHDLSELLQKRKQQAYTQQEAPTRSSISGNSTKISENTAEAVPLLEKTRQLTEAIKHKPQSLPDKKTRNLTLDYESVFSNSERRGKNKPFFQSRVEINLSEKLEKGCDKNEGLSTCEKRSPLPNTGQALQGHSVEKDACFTSKRTVVDKSRKTRALDATKTKSFSKEQERYLELTKSGWILDRHGKWVKDESVEFDSDEDEPPLIK